MKKITNLGLVALIPVLMATCGGSTSGSIDAGQVVRIAPNGVNCITQPTNHVVSQYNWMCREAKARNGAYYAIEKSNHALSPCPGSNWSRLACR